ncbi:MAG: AmmeMemoRadiSam system protein B [Deltaproteobacteria bacterium]
MTIRRAAVAGQFYDGDPKLLNFRLSQYIGTVAKARPAIALIAPHAGYMYSGAVAGAAYAEVDVPETVVILGVNHTGLGARAAVMATGAWAMPMGTVPIASDLASLLLGMTSSLEDDVTAHLYEHSLEVQVPFLQFRQPALRIVPICLGGLAYDTCEEIGGAIALAVGRYGKPALIVASTDMTHYESQERANAQDRLAIDRILALDPRGLYETVRGHGISMCGVIPTTITLVAAKALGAKRARLVRYATSGDVTGDYRQVVGYASFIVD